MCIIDRHRVYPLVADTTSNDNGNVKQSETPCNPKVLQAQLETLREERERERQQLHATIDDLRDRLNAATDAREKAADDVRRLTLMLTHQQPPKVKSEPLPASAAFLGASVWFWVVLAITASAAGSWFWWRG